MVTSLQGLYGFGDVLHFFHLSQFDGLPFINYWDEHPPLNAFLTKLFYYIVGGKEQNYASVLYLFFMVVDAGSLVFFIRLVRRLVNPPLDQALIWFFTTLLIALPYYWWYFDGFGSFWILVSLDCIFSKRDKLSGVALSMGILTKLFPVLLLAGVWRALSWRRALTITLIALGITLGVYGGLYLLSPKFTLASIASQANKGSWETVWALIDGNYQTGNFLVEVDHLYPERAYELRRNPAVINPYLTLLFFGGLGLWVFVKASIKTNGQLIAFLGLALVILFIWSPGWSPQYLLYLIPLVLITFPSQQGRLVTAILVLINLLEWPVLLSRRLNSGLEFTVPIRTIVFILVGIIWYQQVIRPGKPTSPAETSPVMDD